jgi:hypothetical protein
VGEVVVRNLDGCGLVEELLKGRCVPRQRGWVALSTRRRTRAVGQEAAAQGRKQLDGKNLVSRAG